MGDAALSGAVFGSTPLPAWVTSQAVGTWGTVPTSNTVPSLNPNNNSALNPNFPAAAPWNGSGQSAIVVAWCSMATDPLGTLWLWGGGHADYGGNEPYALNLVSAAPTWVMRRPPSGSLASPATDVAPDSSSAGIAASATGFFSDGRPRPPHTYGSHIYVPGKGMAVTNLLYCWPHVNGPQKAVYFNEATNDWGLLADYTSLGNVTSYGVGSCYDPTRNCVWFVSMGTYSMTKINVATGVTTRHGVVDNWVGEPVSLRYDASRDLIYAVSSGIHASIQKRVVVFDPTNSTFYLPPTYTGTGPSGIDSPNFGDGAAWDEAGGRFLLWRGGLADRTQIGTLTRPTNPKTDSWVLGSISVSGANAVTPTPALTNHTFNRFEYITALGICVLINSINDPVYFFKLRSV